MNAPPSKINWSAVWAETKWPILKILVTVAAVITIALYLWFSYLIIKDHGKSYVPALMGCGISALSAAFIAGTLVFQSKQITALTEQKKTQDQSYLLHLLGDILRQWNSDAMLKSRHRTCERTSRREEPEFKAKPYYFSASQINVAAFFEYVGLLFKENKESQLKIWTLFAWYIESYWILLNPKMEKTRTQDPNAFSEFTCLVDEVRKINAIKGSKNVTEEDAIKTFVHSELMLTTRLLSPYHVPDVPSGK